MISADADIFEIYAALRGPSDDDLRLLKREQVCDDAVNQQCQLGHKHSLFLELRCRWLATSGRQNDQSITQHGRYFDLARQW